MPAVQETIDQVRLIDVDQYKYGFETEVEMEKAPKGLSEDVIRFISAKKGEPEWMLAWRLDAYKRWQHHDRSPTGRACRTTRSTTTTCIITPGPKTSRRRNPSTRSIPRFCKTYEKLGIPLREQEILAGVEPRNRVAVDAVFDSVSVATTFKDELAKAGVIFCRSPRRSANIPIWSGNISARSCPSTDNFFATLNSAVFTDGSFVYIPPGVRCPMELSTYFRINEKNTGQFERTLIIADKGSYVSYLEGCTAPMRDKNQLHAAVVELIALDDAEIKYSTVQNWYPGDAEGRAASTTSSPSAAIAAARTRSSPGPRSRPVRRSRGNTRPAFCAATVRAASSTRSRCRTARSRSIPAPR